MRHPPPEWGVCASASVKAPLRSVASEHGAPGTGRGCGRTGAARCHRCRSAVRRASDGTVVTSWRTDGVVVDVPNAVDGPGLQTGDVVTKIGGQRLADGLGDLARPQLGDEVGYAIVRDGLQVTVRMERQGPVSTAADGVGPGLRRRAGRSDDSAVPAGRGAGHDTAADLCGQLAVARSRL